MEPSELRRSTLERKDRDELVTIATALGTKPPSRARKAEIVDLIITTATTGSTDESSDGGDDAEAEKDGGGEVKNDADSGDGDNGTTYHAGDDEFDFGEVTTKEAGRGRKKGKADNKGAKNNAKNGAKNGEGEDVPERGNRRRRRRGRGGDNDANTEPVSVEGYLDLRDDGYGFLRVGSSRSSMEDAYVSVKQVRQFGLRKGDHLIGTSRPANRNEKNPALLTLESINGSEPDGSKDRRRFDDLTPIHPTELLSLEGSDAPVSARVIDLLTPIGKGQRGLIVAPPRSGKTSMVKEIATSIEANHPQVNLLVLAIDERPEDGTEIARSVEEAEVIVSVFDRPGDEHTALVDMTIERAKRLVEMGRDVVIVFDGLTRLIRAQGQVGSASGRMLPGGIEAGSIYAAKRVLGAARALEEGGSLTVIATVNADDESTADTTILDALAGLSNMELHLHRSATELAVFPAVDVEKSFTRYDALLADDKVNAQLATLRTSLADADDPSGDGLGQLQALLGLIEGSKNNADLLKDVAKGV